MLPAMRLFARSVCLTRETSKLKQNCGRYWTSGILRWLRTKAHRYISGGWTIL